MLYDWIIALHVISIIAWMVGLFYLPRLFAYHAGLEIGSQASELLKRMETRTYWIVMVPGLVVSYLTGFYGLYLQYYWLQDAWMHTKLLLVVFMTIYHFFVAGWRNKFREDSNRRMPKFYRAVSEVPTILMIVIVIMVVVKPF